MTKKELEKIYLLKFEELNKKYIKHYIDHNGDLVEYCLDNEPLHIECDQLLLDLLLQLKFEKLIKLYKNNEEYFWYS